MLLLYYGTRAYLLSPDEGSCYDFSTGNNCCEFLASYGIIFQNNIKSSLLNCSWVMKNLVTSYGK